MLKKFVKAVFWWLVFAIGFTFSAFVALDLYFDGSYGRRGTIAIVWLIINFIVLTPAAYTPYYNEKQTKIAKGLAYLALISSYVLVAYGMWVVADNLPADS